MNRFERLLYCGNVPATARGRPFFTTPASMWQAEHDIPATTFFFMYFGVSAMMSCPYLIRAPAGPAGSALTLYPAVTAPAVSTDCVLTRAPVAISITSPTTAKTTLVQRAFGIRPPVPQLSRLRRDISSRHRR